MSTYKKYKVNILIIGIIFMILFFIFRESLIITIKTQLIKPPYLSSVIYISDLKTVDVIGIIKYEDIDNETDDEYKDIKDNINIYIKTAKGFQMQIKKVYSTEIPGIFLFSYSVPIGRININEIKLPKWYDKYIRQQIKIIRYPEKRFQQWSFPHTIKCQISIRKYQILPNITRIDKSNINKFNLIVVPFIIKKK